MTAQLMQGKRGLIMGLANDKSIAWGIAKACADAGADLAFSYQGEALKKRVGPLAASVGSDIVLPCDVGDESSIDALFAALEDRWGKLDFIVHAIGFSDKNELRGRYVDTSRDNFLMSMDISVYSFTAVVQRAEKMLNEGGSCLTLTYYGAEKVMPQDPPSRSEEHTSELQSPVPTSYAVFFLKKKYFFSTFILVIFLTNSKISITII